MFLRVTSNFRSRPGLNLASSIDDDRRRPGSFETRFGRKQFLRTMHMARSFPALPCLNASKDLAL
jgi:hypothetical protein